MIVLAGPSGAGKSTFIHQLAADQLQADITEQLPPGAQTWAQIHNLRPHSEWLPTLANSMQQGRNREIILQYDLTCRSFSYVHDYGSDPVLQLLPIARDVLVINLRADRERLIRQWAYAKLGVRTHRELRRKEFAWRIARCAQIASRALQRISPKAERAIANMELVQDATKRVNAQLYSVRDNPLPWLHAYRRPGGVEAIFDRWDAFLTSMAAQGVSVRQIHLEPEPNAPIADRSNYDEGQYRWRISRIAS